MVNHSPGRGLPILNIVAGAMVVLAVGGMLTAAALVLAKEKPAHGFDVHALPAQAQEAYLAAEQHQDLFVHLPCYCGCAVLPEPHRHLLDCFLKPAGGYDTHASSCSTCVDIALETVKADEEGLGHAAIRALVEARFSDRGPPTKTALP
jgi:hypothetical protein